MYAYESLCSLLMGLIHLLAAGLPVKQDIPALPVVAGEQVTPPLTLTRTVLFDADVFWIVHTGRCWFQRQFIVVFRFVSLQFSTKTAEADTSSELAKKSKESFRKEVRHWSNVIGRPLIQCSDYLCVFVSVSDVPVYSAMSKSLSKAWLQIGPHQ